MDTTLTGQQAPQVQELSEESKQKVSLITDINSIFRLLSKGQNINVHQFDMLYDSEIRLLEQTYYNYRHSYNMQSVTI